MAVDWICCLQPPAKLRFENPKKNAQVNLAFFLFYDLFVTLNGQFSNHLMQDLKKLSMWSSRKKRINCIFRNDRR